MKRILIVLMMIVLAFCLAGCGESNDEPKTAELAMIADCDKIEDGSFTQATWESVESFAKDNALTAKCYKTEAVVDPDEAAKAAKEGKEIKGPLTKEESYMKAIDKAVKNKAKLVIMAGSNFETTVYSAQSTYPDVKFLLIDGVPHDAALNFATAANTIGVIFAEEEAGYLAGYAVVKEGYNKIGFMGGQEIPAVKRYGYGFVQGAAAAAAEMEKKVEMSYVYTGTFDPSKDIRKMAADKFKEGTQVIFACGGAMGTSIMEAAENNGGLVVGVDVDQSYLSSSVLTSAKKEINVVINEMLENYVDDKFVGGIAFNYAAKNGGVSLEMNNDAFVKFSEDDYKKVFRQLKNGKIQLKKDTGVGAVTELTGEWVNIK